MDRLFLSPPHMSGRELEYIKAVFDSNYIAPVGEFIDRFEEAIRDYTGTSDALAVVNATSALHLALLTIGVGEGDIVLASTFTFIGSVDAIVYQRATPYFIDSDESWNLSPKLLKEAIKSSPKKPKALIVTHLYGQMAKIDEIANICQAEGIVLIEDSAESLGAKLHGRDSGTFGEFGVFSFNGNKILTTSGGGVLISPNREYIDRAKYLSTQSREPVIYYEHKEIGYNYRMSNVLAAIGVAQMEVLDERVAKKREIFNWYSEELKGIDEIEFMPEIEGSRGNRWLTTILFNKTNPYRIIDELNNSNIESRPLWKPMHLQPVFKDALSLIDGTSEDMFNRGLCLPSGTAMSRDDVKRVCDIIKRVL